MTLTVHVVEPGGRGGVYHHAACLAEALRAAGVPVVLHTAADAEAMPVQVVHQPCFWRFAGTRPAIVRRGLIAAGWLAGGVPSCLADARRGDVVHIEGRFKPALLVPLVEGARLRRCRLTFSPHNTFSRDDREREERVVRWIARRAETVFAFSEHDRRQIESWGASAVRAPLLAPTPTPDRRLIAEWRRRWGAGNGRPVVLLAGQLRADKGLDLLVRAVSRCGDELLLAVVGEDLGALDGARRLARQLGVGLEVDAGYQPLSRFIAAVAAADVVACPYRIASQSAVLTMARALGRPTVATDVGGLSELASVVVPAGDPEALARGVQKALGAGSLPLHENPGDQIGPYLEAFGVPSGEPVSPGVARTADRDTGSGEGARRLPSRNSSIP